jgi:hypothetical protein
VPRLVQYPILRIPFQGRIGITAFAFIAGFICALKPIRQARAGHIDSALGGIARSAFRRVPRLVLPAAIATVLAWFLCQFGAFVVASASENAWLKSTAPKPAFSMSGAVNDLLWNLITTWTRGANMYDAEQWTLWPLLKGAFVVYIMCFATIFAKPRYRMMISFGGVIYYYICNECNSPQCSAPCHFKMHTDTSQLS